MGVACILIGALWWRAVVAVKRSIAHRKAMVQRLADVTSQMPSGALQGMVGALVRLQAHVRRRQAAVALARTITMDAFEAATPHRRLLLLLVNVGVGLYLAACLYIIMLYGAWVHV
jgi:hypothetical protein